MMKKTAFIVMVGLIAVFCTGGCKKTDMNPTEGENKPTAEVITEPVREEETPNVTFSFREEAEEEKDGDFVYFKSTLYYPVFEGENEEKLNGLVEAAMKEFREYLPDAKENAKLDYEDSQSGNYGDLIFPEVEEFTVSCVWEKEQYLTLFSKWYSDIGGVHPNILCSAYVVDISKGEPVEIEKLLQPYGIDTEKVAEYAAEMILAEYGDELYVFEEGKTTADLVYGFTQNYQWYFSEEGLVLFANPYEIAPYASGMIACVISYEELEQGLKN